MSKTETAFVKENPEGNNEDTGVGAEQPEDNTKYASVVKENPECNNEDTRVCAEQPEGNTKDTAVVKEKPENITKDPEEEEKSNGKDTIEVLESEEVSVSSGETKEWKVWTKSHCSIQ